jgi:acetyl/propionyl-CoA carboxylase alpha subunit
MPGAIQSVAVKAGDKVILAQELVIVEAMKMQNVLRAPKVLFSRSFILSFHLSFFVFRRKSRI